MFEAFPPLKSPTAFKVICWWELRRLIYNLILLIVGVATISGVFAVAGPHIPPGKDVIEPMALFFFIPRFVLIANACYTLGWIVELASRWLDPVAARRRARWMYGLGVIFACVMTSLPFWFACAHWIGQPVVSQ